MIDKFRKNLLCNPFYIYIYSFSLVFVVYAFDWSNLYPVLSLSTYVFFAVTFLISAVLGTYFHKRNQPFFVEKKKSPDTIRIYFIFAVVLVMMDVVYSGKIPILEAAKGVQYEDLEYGIPTLHVFIVSYVSFLATYIFYSYLITKKRFYLVYYGVLLICPLLVLSRSNLLFIIISSLFVYLLYKGKDVYKVLFKLFAFVVLLLLAFGYLGNLRSSYELESYSDPNEFIMTVGDAKESFRNSAVPKAYFWAYLYISSPLANLQENVDHPSEKYNLKTGLAVSIQRQYMWDFLSRRLLESTNTPLGKFQQIAPVLTVGTTYAESFLYLKWYGVIIQYLYITFITFFYLVLLPPRNPFYVAGIAVLNTIILLNIFDNMLIYTPLSIQLVFPFVFGLRLFKKKSATKKIETANA